MGKKEEVLTLVKAESEFGSYYEIKIGDRSTGQLCADEALGFIAHKLFRSIEKEHLYGLKDILPSKDKALQEYIGKLYICNDSTELKAWQEINARLKALEAVEWN